MSYKMSIGLELHIKLNTKTKMFCGCKTEFGAEPNSQCCPVCLGLPGSLPVLNKRAIEGAIKAGIATGCSINMFSKLDRKNYFYPDLAKAYQVSQYYLPICKDGHVKLDSGKSIEIKGIHIEEDAGKIVYEDESILIDYNRSGIPLMEVVTTPDMNSAEEALEFVSKLISIMRYIGVSDCRMEEGAVRFDVNISVSREGESRGVKVEVKNINSLKNLRKAIEFEKERQVSILKLSQKVRMETRCFNESLCKTQAMRPKEESSDYRYFADPDLPPIEIDEKWLRKIREKMPVPFDEKVRIYTKEYNIPAKDAETILKYKKVDDFFRHASQGIKNKRIISNFILGEIFSTFKTEKEKQNFNINISADDLMKLSLLVEEKRISPNLAKARLKSLINTGILDLSVDTVDKKDLCNLIKDTLDKNMHMVNDYFNGKTSAIEPLIGKILRKTNKSADPIEVRREIVKLLDGYTQRDNIDK